ncbi:WhiB family transcriptional regulator [Tessaracoccus defluvii]|uniref:Transcriptional regulator WhiB n=1 Tax=Tessaracoccus defluvii TaxID=1285901 RepID=A0A7H0H5T1_9ACTN|nr:WhiB family transcriptional regulator [Tessaracoccus defluvii]QNP55897.1 WhiB family transcriptional regulator [Tessaracoccus defluvii]
MSLAEASEWTLYAKCRDMADALFPEGKDQKRARSVCVGCPVRSECLAEALDNRIEWGVWGGMTERERRALLRARPDIESWHEVLVEAAVPPVGITVLPGGKD